LDYKKRYGLKEAPFRLSPDPDFFFPSETHRDALETLLYSIRAGEGFIQITGRPGTGKSMLLRKIFKEIGDSVVVGLILHANIEARDLLQMLMQDLKIDISGVRAPSRGNLIPLFRDFLLAQARDGKQVIIIVDEAQNLQDETLEELRMLSNLETEKAKLLQIILVGQLELEQRITPDRLSQLAQRITIRYRLKPLNREETRAYIFHRLEIAAIDRDQIPVSFQAGVMRIIHKYTQGVPRLINIVCERSLMAAYIQGSGKITLGHVKKAIQSIEGEPDPGERTPLFRPFTYGLIAVFLATAALWGYLRANPDTSLVPSRMLPLVGAVMDGSTSGDTTYKIPREPRKEAVQPPMSLTVPPVETEGARLEEQKNLSSVVTAHQIQPPPLPGVSPKLPAGHLSGLQPDSINEFIHMDQWLALPRGVEQVGLINIDRGTLLMVGNKNDDSSHSGQTQARQVQIKWPYPQGVYMAGYSTAGERFIFHPEITYLKKLELDNPEFWEMVRTGNKNRITPLVAVTFPSRLSNKIKPGADTVQQTVSLWAETWRSMENDKVMDYFSNVTSVYSIDTDQPLVFSKARMSAIKQNILRQSSFIHLGLTDPICLINPLDPNLAYAVFHQTYRSNIYQDRGTKVLYMRRLNSSSAEPQWKITGKLWILDPDLKPSNTMTP